MNRAAVVIGVDKAGTLPVLNAAVSGARNFAAWVEAHHFDVSLITDANGQPVRVADIADAVERIVDARTYVQLIVYFAGHGVLRGPDNELWLLSKAPGNANEAVIVPRSIWLARNSGIKHVVFISDACRSVPDSPQMNAVVGSVIFPNRDAAAPRPEVDLFYAALPGDPAYEAPAAEAAGSYRGLFTECLLRGLNHLPAAVMEERADPPPPTWVVPSWKMKLYLEEELPEAATAVSIQLTQDPDIRVESHAPACLIECPDYEPPAVDDVTERTVAEGTGATTSLLDEILAATPAAATGPLRQVSPLPSGVLARGVHDAVERLLAAPGRRGFETQTGFTFIGATPTRATAGPHRVDLFEEDAAIHARVHWSGPEHEGGSLLVQFESGIGGMLAVLPGFVGTVVVERDRIVTVSYRPSAGTDAFDDYEHRAEEFDKRQAVISSMARQGVFRLDPASASGTADYLRIGKRFDPTLGLYAAYAYAQVGAVDDVVSVHGYMESDPAPVLFDVALLADKLGEGTAAAAPLTRLGRVAPCCPVLSQGWSMLGAYEDRLDPDVRAARPHLVPALWTTLAAEGVDILWPGVEQGRLQ